MIPAIANVDGRNLQKQLAIVALAVVVGCNGTIYWIHTTHGRNILKKEQNYMFTVASGLPRRQCSFNDRKVFVLDRPSAL